MRSLGGPGGGKCRLFPAPHGPLFCTWLELHPGFLRGTGLAPATGLGSLPFRLASYPLVCGIVTSFSYASDALFFTRSLSTGTTPWVRFSPHPLWPGPLGLGLEHFLFPALAPWTPRGSRPDSFSSPLMGEQPKMSRKARHHKVLVWPMSLSRGRVGLGGTLKVTLESETAAWRL